MQINEIELKKAKATQTLKRYLIPKYTGFGSRLSEMTGIPSSDFSDILSKKTKCSYEKAVLIENYYLHALNEARKPRKNKKPV